MRRKVAPCLSLLASVCLLAIVFPLTGQAQTVNAQQNKGKSATKKPPLVDKTLSSEGAKPTVIVAPKGASKAAVNFMTPLELEIMNEMNLARTEPQKYAAFVEEFKKYYDGNRLTIPGRKKAIITNDGIAAVDEAINFLRAQQPLPAFEASKGVCSAASDHAKDLAGTGISGHRGSDGSSPNARVDRYGRWEGAIGETIVYEVTTARQIIIALIIDDGVPNRGHRRNIFDPNYKLAGISISEPLSFGAKCVIDYVGGFKEKAPDIK
ncbi:MAG TPA: CAP domain-containing protein [Pyrinomonadaceae bacterium]